ncbi:MAG: hypothetical protein ACOVO1_05445, partial [Chitinophagaceae bacterium]
MTTNQLRQNYLHLQDNLSQEFHPRFTEEQPLETNFNNKKQTRMNKIYNTSKVGKIALAFLMSIAFSVIGFQKANAQVSVSGADATTNAGSPYATLKAAFDAINGQSQTGNTILISITANTTETASAALNNGAWTSLSISPSGGAFTIGGSVAGPLVSLSGADNVTIDGLNSGGN